MPENNLKNFKEKFPSLFKEMKNQEQKIDIDGVRTNRKEGEKATKQNKHSGPNVVDFIRLCDTEDEALEIIDYMKKKEKIEPEYAEKLEEQLAEEGLRSFGSKRGPGEYSFTD